MKLYDLTSLCSELNEEVNQNPFTTPVAMLLFKYVSVTHFCAEHSPNFGAGWRGI